MSVYQEEILGHMLTFTESAADVAEQISPKWFSGQYRKAFDFLSAKPGADIVVTSKETGISTSELARWVNDHQCTPTSVKYQLQALRKEYEGRCIQNLQRQLTGTATAQEATKLIDLYLETLGGNDKSEPMHIRKAALALNNELEERCKRKGQLMGISYGINALDDVTQGLHSGDLIVVSAASSMGKTAFAMGVAEAVCREGKKVLAFSGEMSATQLLTRTLSSTSGVGMGKIRAAEFADGDWNRMTEAFGDIFRWDMWIDDQSGIDVDEVVRKCKRQKRKTGLDLVVVDYLQIMGYDQDRENIELGTITKRLKNLAREISVPVIVLSQLNRSGQAQQRKPVMTDLRGSGMIENNADVILFPWRPHANCEQCQTRDTSNGHSTEAHQAEAEIIIGKQRQGERNVSVKVKWEGHRTRFIDDEKKGGWHV